MFSLLSIGATMKVIVQSFLYCCLLATVAHCVELEVNSQLKKRWVIHSIMKMFFSMWCKMWQQLPVPWIFLTNGRVFLLYQAQHMAREQNEMESQQCVGREDSRVWAPCQTRRYQGNLAAAFQVRHWPCYPENNVCLVFISFFSSKCARAKGILSH